MSIASASTTLKFHDFPTGSLVHDYKTATSTNEPIRSISWSKDGNWLSLVPHCGLAEIVSVKEELKLIHKIQGIENLSCASFQNTTKKIIGIGTKDGQVLIYDIKARNVKKRFPGSNSLVTRLAFAARDSYIVTACQNGEAFLYSNVTNSLIGSFKIPRSTSISALQTNPIKRNYVAAGSNEGVVAVWDIHKNKAAFFNGAHKAPVTDVTFSPVNSDLIVSTGFDRQFCFYDLSSNKCIANIFVENSMTAVDFSPDGKYIIMASQKGNIYIYDTKSLQQPVHSFFAHNDPITHLFFRKCEDYESSFSLPEENMAKSVNEPSHIEQNNISFGLCLVSYSEQNNTSHVSSLNATQDSFMVAVGLDQNNTNESMRPDSLKMLENKRTYCTEKSTPSNPSKLLQEKKSFCSKTSTPNCLIPEAEAVISPIVKIDTSDSHTLKKSNDNIQELVKKTVKEELQLVSEELKKEMKYYSTHILTETRQMMMQLLMFITKENMKHESSLNVLQNALFSDLPQDQESLLAENWKLKEKICTLETILKTQHQ